MGPTRLSVLGAVALAGLAVGYLLTQLVDRYSSWLLPLSWLTPGLMLFFAVLLLGAARTVRGWVTERRYDRNMTPLRAARMLALAKAGAVFGAAATGGYLGVALAMLGTAASEYAMQNVWKGLATSLSAVAVILAALYLERSCIAPGGGSDTPDALAKGI